MRCAAGVAMMLLVLHAPLSLASWSSQGEAEPSTRYDLPSFMWPDAPGQAVGRIYFNVVGTIGSTGAGGGLVNPNVATLGTRFESVGVQVHEAMLGVWADCNGDGYVGMGESALREYPSELLLDHGVCRAATGPPNSWSGAHDYNGWVSELIPIANREAGVSDARIIRDEHAMVWGDYGRPEPTRVACGGGDASEALLAALDCVAHDAPAPLPRIEERPPKRAAEWNFRFVAGHRGAFPVSLVRGGSAGADGTLGFSNEGSRWIADAYAVSPTPRTLDAEQDDLFASARWYTFYAHVGSATLGLGYQVPGGSAGYGSAFCGSFTTGVHHGWHCDAAAWYTHADGTPYHETKRTLARPGQTYQLRDVDCHDGGIGDTGVGVGAPYYGSHPCSAG